MPRGKSRPKIKLTKTRVDQLKSDDPSGTRFYDSELPKYGITVFATGKRSWFIEYMAGNRRRRFTLGHYPDLLPDKARIAALRTMADIAEGIDPIEAKEAKRNARTFGQWVDEYLVTLEDRKKATSIRADKRYLGRANERWARRPLEEITLGDVEQYVQWQKTLGVVNANRALASLKTCLGEAWRRELISENPATRVRRLREPPPRNRTLSDDEFKRVVGALDSIDDIYVKAAFVLLLETGARQSEVLNMKWEDVNLTDLDRAEWYLPNPKRQRPETKPLTRSTAEMLINLSHRGPYVCARSTRETDEPRVSIWWWWNKVRTEAKLDGIILHDLRRTFGLEVARKAGLHIASKLLGHSSIQITERVYAPLGIDDLREAAETVSKDRPAVVLPFKNPATEGGI